MKEGGEAVKVCIGFRMTNLVSKLLEKLTGNTKGVSGSGKRGVDRRVVVFGSVMTTTEK
jgi:hypothetical protein